MNNTVLVIIGFFIFFLIPYYVIFSKNLNSMIYYSNLWKSVTATIPDVTVPNLLYGYIWGKKADTWKKKMYNTKTKKWRKNKNYSMFQITGLFFFGFFIFFFITNIINTNRT